MFIRKKKNKSGSTSVQIIQKQQGKYKVVKSLGASYDKHVIEKYYRLAQEAIPKMFNQLTFLEGPFNYPRIDELSNDNIRVVGPELVFGKIFNHIGFNKIPDELFKLYKY